MEMLPTDHSHFSKKKSIYSNNDNSKACLTQNTGEDPTPKLITSEGNMRESLILYIANPSENHQSGEKIFELEEPVDKLSPA